MKYYAGESIAIVIENDFALKTHIRNGQKPTMDRQQKQHCVRACVCVWESEKKTQVHALLNAITFMH